MPLTLLTGVYGMNVAAAAVARRRHAQFWWLSGIMLTIAVAMLSMFRRKRWI